MPNDPLAQEPLLRSDAFRANPKPAPVQQESLTWREELFGDVQIGGTYRWEGQYGEWAAPPSITKPRIQIAGNPVAVAQVLLPTSKKTTVLVVVKSVEERTRRAYVSGPARAMLMRDGSGAIGILVLGGKLGLRVADNNTGLPYLIVGFNGVPEVVSAALHSQLPSHQMERTEHGTVVARLIEPMDYLGGSHPTTSHHEQP